MDILKNIYFSCLLTVLIKLQLTLQSEQKSIQAVYGFSTNNYNIILEIGNPEQILYLKIDMSVGSSWMTDNCYHIKESRTNSNISHKKIKIGYFNYDSVIVSDQLHFINKEISLQKFYFNLLDGERPEGAYDSLSLAYQFENKTFSIINQLFEEGLIAKKKFSFVPKEDKVGVVYFGDLPQEVVIKKYETKCKVQSNHTTWGCNLQKVIIGNDVYSNSAYAYFNTIDSDILAPLSFINFLKKHYLSSYLENKICSFESGTQSYRCNCTKMGQLPQFMMVFDGKGIELNNKIIFTDYSPRCFLRIRENYKSNDWVIGTRFLNNHIMSFDYDNDEISIYTETNPFSLIFFNYTGLVQSVFVRGLLYVITFSFILCIFILGFFKLKLGKANTKTDGLGKHDYISINI